MIVGVLSHGEKFQTCQIWCQILHLFFSALCSAHTDYRCTLSVHTMERSASLCILLNYMVWIPRAGVNAILINATRDNNWVGLCWPTPAVVVFEGRFVPFNAHQWLFTCWRIRVESNSQLHVHVHANINVYNQQKVVVLNSVTFLVMQKCESLFCEAQKCTNQCM